MSAPVCRECGRSHDSAATCPEPLRINDTELVSAGPGTQLGSYRLLQVIGAGRMGRVFRALDTKLDRPVAIKIISPEYLLGNRQAVERFLREARLTARIRHPNIVRVFDLGTDTCGSPYLVMELLEGRTLRRALAARERFPVERIVSIGTQILSALAAAHEHAVHRDLKPENIFLTRLADGESVTVLDFGVAKAVKAAGADLTREPRFVPGAEPFTAPEILDGTGRRDDPRQDLYSLGVMLFEMATGKLPGADGRGPRPLYDVARRLDPYFAEVVDRALAVDPARRWQTAQQFRTALRSFGLFAPGVLVDHTYRIVGRVGKGGMSVVYLARDVRMERSCALKALLIADEDDPGGVQRERFRRDGALAKDVRHPNVVEAYAQGVWRGRPYLVTEYIEGTTLREYLRTASWPSLVVAVQQIASALDAVHEAGIVHRDVKPATRTSS